MHPTTANNSRKITHSIPHGPTLIMLYGEPGAGKTITTIYAAEHLHRPLISLSPGNLGSIADFNQFSLDEFLKRVRRWNAILVIEDAHAIFENQPGRVHTQNSFAMICLDLLESHTGVIILTTTRPEVIDISLRLQIVFAIECQLGEDNRRQIWYSLICNSLDNESYEDSKAELLLNENLDDLSGVPLNGKQIRTAFKALVQAAAVRANHRESVEWEDLWEDLKIHLRSHWRLSR